MKPPSMALNGVRRSETRTRRKSSLAGTALSRMADGVRRPPCIEHSSGDSSDQSLGAVDRAPRASDQDGDRDVVAVGEADDADVVDGHSDALRYSAGAGLARDARALRQHPRQSSGPRPATREDGLERVGHRRREKLAAPQQLEQMDAGFGGAGVARIEQHLSCGAVVDGLGDMGAGFTDLFRGLCRIDPGSQAIPVVAEGPLRAIDVEIPYAVALEPSRDLVRAADETHQRVRRAVVASC